MNVFGRVGGFISSAYSTIKSNIEKKTSTENAGAVNAERPSSENVGTVANNLFTSMKSNNRFQSLPTNMKLSRVPPEGKGAQRASEATSGIFQPVLHEGKWIEAMPVPQRPMPKPPQEKVNSSDSEQPPAIPSKPFALGQQEKAQLEAVTKRARARRIQGRSPTAGGVQPPTIPPKPAVVGQQVKADLEAQAESATGPQVQDRASSSIAEQGKWLSANKPTHHASPKARSKVLMRNVNQQISACYNEKGKQVRKLKLRPNGSLTTTNLGVAPRGTMMGRSTRQTMIGQRSGTRDALNYVVEQIKMAKNLGIAEIEIGGGKKVNVKDLEKQFMGLSQVKQRVLIDKNFKVRVNALKQQNVESSDSIGASSGVSSGIIDAKVPDSMAKDKIFEEILLEGNQELADLQIVAHKSTSGTQNIIADLNTALKKVQSSHETSPVLQARATDNAMSFAVRYLADATSVPLKGPEREKLIAQLQDLQETTASSSGALREQLNAAVKELKKGTKPVIPPSASYDEALQQLKERNPQSLEQALQLLQEGAYLQATVETAPKNIEKFKEDIDKLKAQLNKGENQEEVQVKMEGLQAKIAAEEARSIELKDVYDKHSMLRAEVKEAAKQELEKMNFSLLGGPVDDAYRAVDDLMNHLSLQVSPSELDNLAWSKADRRDLLAPNATAAAQAHNQLTYLLAEEILNSEQPKRQIAKVIDLLEKAYDNHQYAAAMVLSSVLSDSSVHRLSSWDDLDSKRQEMYTRVKKGLSSDSNSAVMRARVALAEAEGKVVTPYLGTTLTDVTFAMDGSPDEIEGRVNLRKQKLLADAKQRLPSLQLRSNRHKELSSAAKQLDFVRQLHTAQYEKAGQVQDGLWKLSKQKWPTKRTSEY